MGQATERQINALRKFKVPDETLNGITFEDASKILDEKIKSVKSNSNSNYNSGTVESRKAKPEYPTGHLTENDMSLSSKLGRYYYIAYDFVKKLHPSLPEDSQTFGQIMSSTVDKLISIENS